MVMFLEKARAGTFKLAVAELCHNYGCALFS